MPEVTKYLVENPIPNEDSLYLRVHRNNIDFEILDPIKKIKPMAFDPHPMGSTGLSVNWQKYSNPEETKNQARKPHENGVLSCVVLNVRGINPLDVEHCPSSNRAHSHINNVPSRKNNATIRMKLRDIFKWEIECNIDTN